MPRMRGRQKRMGGHLPALRFSEKSMRVSAVDLDIGFGNLVGLLVKLVLAAVPALIILVVLAAIVASFISGMK
jgi:hypothetical protein